MDIFYIDRKTGERKKEVVAGEKFLKWVTDTKSVNTILDLVVRKKFFSSLYGKLQDISYSKRKIISFVQQLEIDMKEAVDTDIKSYKTFNEFFTRKLKADSRPINQDTDILISPADGRVLAYENIDIEKIVQIKGSHYTLSDLFQNNELASRYEGGTCIVVRLNPSDYHRFHFPDGGTPQKYQEINGHYYSVNPMALSKIVRVYCQNKRQITIFNSDNFGNIAYLEIGATCVGSIIQTYSPEIPVQKGSEKGYFKFGGSTVILFFEKDKVKIDEDIINNTLEGMETKVLMGESIGRK